MFKLKYEEFLYKSMTNLKLIFYKGVYFLGQLKYFKKGLKYHTFTLYIVKLNCLKKVLKFYGWPQKWFRTGI